MVTREVAGVVSELPWATADFVAEVVAFQVASSLRCLLSNRSRLNLVLRLVLLYYVAPLAWHQTQTFMMHSTTPMTTTPVPNLTFANNYLRSRH